MKTKFILTSAIAIMTAMPAMATSYSAGDSANCDNSVLNVYSGSASATAGFSAKSYTCAAGQYLPDGDTWTGLDDGCDTCPANSYCPGDTYTYSEASDQGATACSTVSNGAYPYSDAGKGTTADCYRNCASGDVANLKSGGTLIRCLTVCICITRAITVCGTCVTSVVQTGPCITVRQVLSGATCI